MYIEFKLDDVYPTWNLNEIKHCLGLWSQAYGIDYRQKTHKLTHRVTFDQTEHYTFFALTWTAYRPGQLHALGQFRLVSDLNNKI